MKQKQKEAQFELAKSELVEWILFALTVMPKKKAELKKHILNLFNK